MCGMECSRGLGRGKWMRGSRMGGWKGEGREARGVLRRGRGRERERGEAPRVGSCLCSRPWPLLVAAPPPLVSSPLAFPRGCSATPCGQPLRPACPHAGATVLLGAATRPPRRPRAGSSTGTPPTSSSSTPAASSASSGTSARPPPSRGNRCCHPPRAGQKSASRSPVSDKKKPGQYGRA